MFEFRIWYIQLPNSTNHLQFLQTEKQDRGKREGLYSYRISNHDIKLFIKLISVCNDLLKQWHSFE